MQQGSFRASSSIYTQGDRHRRWQLTNGHEAAGANVGRPNHWQRAPPGPTMQQGSFDGVAFGSPASLRQKGQPTPRQPPNEAAAGGCVGRSNRSNLSQGTPSGPNMQLGSVNGIASLNPHSTSMIQGHQPSQRQLLGVSQNEATAQGCMSGRNQWKNIPSGPTMWRGSLNSITPVNLHGAPMIQEYHPNQRQPASTHQNSREDCPDQWQIVHLDNQKRMDAHFRIDSTKLSAPHVIVPNMQQGEFNDIASTNSHEASTVPGALSSQWEPLKHHEISRDGCIDHYNRLQSSPSASQEVFNNQRSMDASARHCMTDSVIPAQLPNAQQGVFSDIAHVNHHDGPIIRGSHSSVCQPPRHCEPAANGCEHHSNLCECSTSGGQEAAFYAVSNVWHVTNHNGSYGAFPGTLNHHMFQQTADFIPQEISSQHAHILPSSSNVPSAEANGTVIGFPAYMSFPAVQNLQPVIPEPLRVWQRLCTGNLPSKETLPQASMNTFAFTKHHPGPGHWPQRPCSFGQMNVGPQYFAICSEPSMQPGLGDGHQTYDTYLSRVQERLHTENQSKVQEGHYNHDREDVFSMVSRPSLDSRSRQALPFLDRENRGRKSKSWQTQEMVDRGQLHCDPCGRIFTNLTDFNAHLGSHIKCDEEGCTFEALGKIVKEHKVIEHKKISSPKTSVGRRALVLRSNESEEDVARWLEERKNNYPTKANILQKMYNMKCRQGRKDLFDEAAQKRHQRLREVIQRQKELGIFVADIPDHYLHPQEGAGGRKRCTVAVEATNPGAEIRPVDGNVITGFKRTNTGVEVNRVNKMSKMYTENCDFATKASLSVEGIKAHKASRKTNHKHGSQLDGKPRKRGHKEQRGITDVLTHHHPSLLFNLLKPEIEKEATRLLQCCRFLVNNAFLEGWPSAVLKHLKWIEGGSPDNEETNDVAIHRFCTTDEVAENPQCEKMHTITSVTSLHSTDRQESTTMLECTPQLTNRWKQGLFDVLPESEDAKLAMDAPLSISVEENVVRTAYGDKLGAIKSVEGALTKPATVAPLSVRVGEKVVSGACCDNLGFESSKLGGMADEGALIVEMAVQCSLLKQNGVDTNITYDDTSGSLCIIDSVINSSSGHAACISTMLKDANDDGQGVQQCTDAACDPMIFKDCHENNEVRASFTNEGEEVMSSELNVVFEEPFFDVNLPFAENTDSTIDLDTVDCCMIKTEVKSFNRDLN